MTYEQYMAHFDAESVKNEIVQWIYKWFQKNGPGCNAVIGISGGKDSSVVAALCVEALGKDRVIGILMPNHEQSDIGDAYKLVAHLDIRHATINVGQAVDSLSHDINHTKLWTHGATNFDSEDFDTVAMPSQAKINLPPRIRMATLYAFSQSLNGRVANTCNLSEDYVGYSTRYGDSVGDFSPLSLLTTDEVIAVGRACNLPDELVEKVPSDGLCGMTDENNLGFSYRVLNEYIRLGTCADPKVKEMIDRRNAANRFKLFPMQVFLYHPLLYDKKEAQNT